MGEITLINFSELSFTTRKGLILAEGLTGEVRRGQALLVQGPNGSGKTTFLRTILGLHRHVRGRVDLRIPRARIAYLPQLQNVSFHIPITLRDMLEASSPNFDDSAAQAVGLLEYHQLALGWNTASGGERKKALLTRALLADPDLLILDEPFNHLDAASTAKVKELLASKLTDGERKIGLVFVSHEDSFAGLLSDQRISSSVLRLGAALDA